MFGDFQREFLQNYSAYRAQIFFQYSETLFYWIHHIMISIHVNASRNVNKETPFDGDHGYIENKKNYQLNGKSGTFEIVYLFRRD